MHIKVMTRGSISRAYFGLNADFRYRGEEQTRIETLSDAVFALAITILLISTSSSSNFRELIDFTNELIPFALCIAPIILLWHEHFIFFLRYGLRNRAIVALNSLLLCLVLFYVYPLKFLAEVLYSIFGWMLTGSERLALKYHAMMDGGNMSTMVIIYGGGFGAIYLVFAAMYGYASRHAVELELNEVEHFYTRMGVLKCLLLASVPVLSMLTAFLFRSNPAIAGIISGYVYFLYPPLMWFFGRRVRKKRRALNPVPHES